MNTLKIFMLALLVAMIFGCDKSEEPVITNQLDKAVDCTPKNRSSTYDIMGMGPFDDYPYKVGKMTITHDKKYLTINFQLEFEPVGFWHPRVFIGDLSKMPTSFENFPYQKDYDVDNICSFIKKWKIQFPLKHYKKGDTIYIVTLLKLEINWFQVPGHGGIFPDDCNNEDLFEAWIGDELVYPQPGPHYISYVFTK
ncbi:hypothetical protein NF867_00615 [Solitalea sp. MAHUQ-68]|uniref:Lipoprotein n=1 Tax=Solitalea agri TaxID=2953739 RepID=A0A9X2EYK8_9SPHI|nr:hypothetical protein [Solitalea agri]MCO4291362.1 hypothetical protein [Solitalea agri]